MTDEEKHSPTERDLSNIETPFFRWLYSWFPPKWLLKGPHTEKTDRKLARLTKVYILPSIKWVVNICEVFLVLLAIGVVAKLTGHWLAEAMYIALKLIFFGYFALVFFPVFLALDTIQWRASCAVGLVLLAISVGYYFAVLWLTHEVDTLVELTIELNLRN